MNKKLVRITEIVLLFFLTYFGWALGDRNRLSFSHLTSDDLADIWITAFMIFCGFYYYKWRFESIVHSKSPPTALVKELLSLLSGGYLLMLIIFVVANRLVFNYWWDISFIYHTTPVFIIFSLLVWGYLYLIELKPTIKGTPPLLTTLTVDYHLGKKVLLLEDIVLFESKDKQTLIWLADGQKLRINQPLQSWLSQLPAQQFFKANRQFIVSRKYVAGFTYADHQKLRLTWAPDKTELPEVIISKITAPDFRSWLDNFTN